MKKKIVLMIASLMVATLIAPGMVNAEELELSETSTEELSPIGEMSADDMTNTVEDEIISNESEKTWNEEVLCEDGRYFISEIDEETGYEIQLPVLPKEIPITQFVPQSGTSNLHSSDAANEGEYVYSYTPSDEMLNDGELDAAVQTALSYASSASNTLEKALLLHNYLVINTEYDYSYSRYRAYNALVEHSAVCQGYSEAYALLCNSAGIDCKLVTSRSMNHAWNIVNIDGSWYHVDCTWDDPKFTYNGVQIKMLYYKYFMKSDSGLPSDHFGWTGGNCTNSIYNNAFWNDAYGQMYKVRDEFYFYKNGGLNKIKSPLIYGSPEVVVEGKGYGHKAEHVIAKTDNTIAFIYDYNNVCIYSLNSGKNTVIPVDGGNPMEIIANNNALTVNVVPSGQSAGHIIKLFKFDDVEINPGNWKFESVSYVNSKKIMSGTSDSTFAPSDNVTRAMFATVLYNLDGAKAVSYKAIFKDVEPGKWYSNAITWAANSKVVSGYPDGRFGINDIVTREQMATMMKNYAAYKKYYTKQTADLGTFKDAGKVSSWAIDGMKWAVGSKLLSGKSNNGVLSLDPTSGATRVECATIMKNFCENSYEKMFIKEHFPDEKFRKWIEQCADLNNDGIITAEELAQITEAELDFYEQNYTDMTGIEMLTGLKNLKIRNGSLINFDISSNKDLEEITLTDINMQSLKVPNLPKLASMTVTGCNITTIDFRDCENIAKIRINSGHVPNVVMGNKPKLTDLQAVNTGVENIDVSKCNALMSLNVSKSKLNSLTLDSKDLRGVTLDYVTFANTTVVNMWSDPLFTVKTSEREMDFSKIKMLKPFDESKISVGSSGDIQLNGSMVTLIGNYETVVYNFDGVNRVRIGLQYENKLNQ